MGCHEHEFRLFERRHFRGDDLRSRSELYHDGSDLHWRLGDQDSDDAGRGNFSFRREREERRAVGRIRDRQFNGNRNTLSTVPKKVILTVNEQAPTTDQKPKAGGGPRRASILAMLRGTIVRKPETRPAPMERAPTTDTKGN